MLHVAVAAADDVQLHGVTDGSEDDVRKPSVWTNIVGPAVSLLVEAVAQEERPVVR